MKFHMQALKSEVNSEVYQLSLNFWTVMRHLKSQLKGKLLSRPRKVDMRSWISTKEASSWCYIQDRWEDSWSWDMPIQWGGKIITNCRGRICHAFNMKTEIWMSKRHTLMFVLMIRKLEAWNYNRKKKSGQKKMMWYNCKCLAFDRYFIAENLQKKNEN